MRTRSSRSRLKLCYYMLWSQLLLLGSLWREWHPRRPVLRALLSSRALASAASFAESLHVISALPLFLLPSIFFPESQCFPKKPAFSRCARSRAAPVSSFLPPVLFVLGHTCSSSWRSRVSTELSSNTVFQVNQLFSYQASSLSNVPCTEINNI